jgi:hypothetical protein
MQHTSEDLRDHTSAVTCSSSNKQSAPHTLDWEDAFEADYLQQFSTYGQA